MKRLICLLLCVCFIFVFCACDLTAEGSSSNTAANSASQSSSSEIASSSEPLISSEVIPTDTKPESSSVAQSSENNSSYVLKNYDVEVGEYTVHDAENVRGLSEKKNGFGFGVAKNGKPHTISVDNQARFNKMPNVKALALDTVSTDKRMYLTFDSGYENNVTAPILDTLKEKNVKAAFFLTLSYIKKNPQLVQRMLDEGHIVGNHSATHPVFPDISRTKMADEIYKVDEYLQKHFNYKTDYFRFPTGAYSENSLELVTSVGFKSVFWSVAYADYDDDNLMGPEKALKTVTDRFHSGAVILLHSTCKDNATILADVIDTAHSQGYIFKTLNDYSGF